jgi:hypothetical protein
VLRAVGSGERHDPADLAVVETVRFEGPSDPADEAIVFALTTAAGEPVGTFTALRPEAGPDDADIVERLHRPPFDEDDIRAHQEHDHVVAVFGDRAEGRSRRGGAAPARPGQRPPRRGRARHRAGGVRARRRGRPAHDVEVGRRRRRVVGFLAGFALVGVLVPVVGTVGVGGLLAIGAASGFGGAMLGGYIGVAREERALTVHEQIARTRCSPARCWWPSAATATPTTRDRCSSATAADLSAQRPD